MGYMHINNLYKVPEILKEPEVYALEKIHGTSAHIHCTPKGPKFFSGGAPYEAFVALFKDNEKIWEPWPNADAWPDYYVYGEAYGGKLQKMSATYGPELRFVVFDVYITIQSAAGQEHRWASVAHAHSIATSLGLDFVDYEVIVPCEAELQRVLMKDSAQAIKNGMGPGHMHEGVVLRPIWEKLYGPNNKRLIAKYKREEFAEREHTPNVFNPEKKQEIANAAQVAQEWVTPMRLQHVLDKCPCSDMTHIRQVIQAMNDDIAREGSGELLLSPQVVKAIGHRTVQLFKKFLTQGVFNG